MPPGPIPLIQRTRRQSRGARRRAGGGPTPGGRPRIGLFGGSLFGLRGLALSVLQGGLTIRIPFNFGRNAPPSLPPGALSQAQPVPLPVPTQPAPLPRLENIFGQLGKAANDPVFRRAAAGRLFGIGSIAITAAELLAAEIARRQRKRMEEILREQQEESDEISRRKKRERELETIIIENSPGRSPLPEIDRVSRPSPSPRIPRQPVFLPFPNVVPGLPGALPAPAIPSAPARPTVPRPASLPMPLPIPGVPTLPGAAPLPGPISFPGVIPFFEPFSPLNFISPPKLPFGTQPGNLTGIDPGGLSFGQIGVNPLPNPQQALNTDKCPARKCDDDLEEPRTQCFKGLYKEGYTDTDFTSWVEIDCITGRETPDAGKIIQFPETPR